MASSACKRKGYINISKPLKSINFIIPYLCDCCGGPRNVRPSVSPRKSSCHKIHTSIGWDGFAFWQLVAVRKCRVPDEMDILAVFSPKIFNIHEILQKPAYKCTFTWYLSRIGSHLDWTILRTTRALSREHDILNTLGPGQGISDRKQMTITCKKCKIILGYKKDVSYFLQNEEVRLYAMHEHDWSFW